jgi:mannose-6-phosphate isomerase
VLEPVPSRIEPIFSPRIWGTRSLAPYFPDKTNLAEPLGEAWLTAREAPIHNGPFAGLSLGDAWRSMPPDWRGTRMGATPEFPVLVKFIFPEDKLSIQVHPNDTYAAKHEQAAGGRGKTEMWHIVSNRPCAEILLGLKAPVTQQELRASITQHTIEQLLVRRCVTRGDTYFVPAGTIHAIGPGSVICEVQEYSDLTYRVYDFGRLDSAGKPRELHIAKALEVASLEPTEALKRFPLALHSPDANKHLLVACEFFATERWDCHKMTFIESEAEQFQLIIILEGSGTLHDSNESFTFRSGEAWFLPASLPTLLLQPDRPTSLLRVFVPDNRTLHHQLRSLGFEESVLAQVLVS